MLDLRRFLFVTVGALMLLAPNGNSQINQSSLYKPHVKLQSATRVFVAKDRPAYLVRFEYDFDGLPSVHIKGLGVVPSRGAFQYIWDGTDLEFRDPRNESVLERIPLQETIVVAAKPPLDEIPSENQFSPAYRAYTWELPMSLHERANAVLATDFHYLPHENNKLTYVLTTYTELPLDKKMMDSGVLARLALLMSFPYDEGTGKYSFHIQYCLKEGRALSDKFQPANNPEVIKAADEFVDKLVAEMKAPRQVMP